MDVGPVHGRKREKMENAARIKIKLNIKAKEEKN